MLNLKQLGLTLSRHGIEFKVNKWLKERVLSKNKVIKQFWERILSKDRGFKRSRNFISILGTKNKGSMKYVIIKGIDFKQGFRIQEFKISIIDQF